MPNGAEFRTAPNSERRQIPNGAEFQTAHDSERRQSARDANRRTSQAATRLTAPVVAFRDSAPFGISRRSAFGAVRLAPYKLVMVSCGNVSFGCASVHPEAIERRH